MAAAQSFAMVLGPRAARSPAGHPILIAAPVFDDSEMAPALAIAQAARTRHGIEIHLPAWELIARYRVIDSATVRTGHGAKRIPFETAYVYRYLPESPMRKQLGISESELDHIAKHRPWWAERITHGTQG